MSELHKIVNGVQAPLNEEEIVEFNNRKKQHESELKAYEKVKYLDDRKNDKDMPSLEEKVDAIFEKLLNDDDQKLNELKSRIEVVKLRHKKPEEVVSEQK